MSEVKRYLVCGEHYEVYVDDGGDYVSHEDYAALKAERDALVAENAAQKEYLKECSVVQGEGNWNSTAEKSVYVPAIDWMPPTPATDAYLNSVRAEGVEMFAAALKDKYQGIAYELIGNYETNGEEDRISDEGEIQEVLAFAAQLRAGEPS